MRKSNNGRISRYVIKADEDRCNAGWGEWSWIVDTTKEYPENLVKLLPTDKAEIELSKLNGLH